jgi:hypothetical protein
MRDILKQLNDCNPHGLRALDERGLQRFESLCETWARRAEAELARRRSLPRSELQPNVYSDALRSQNSRSSALARART